jgi:hypothetical protein
VLKNVKNIYIAIVVFLVAQGALQASYIHPTWSKNYSPASGGSVEKELSPDQILLQLFGFREFLAGILWVRADGFFDQGNYDAILPIIKLCTTLDPKEIDIFATGMWHIGYNFTDEDQRSDRRYIPSALALGKAGAAANPDTYELFFETGWMWFHKISDDPWQAVKWLQEAERRPDMNTGRRDVFPIALQRDGEINEALTNYYSLYENAKKEIREGSTEYGNVQLRDTIENNIDTMIVRMVQRGYVAEQRHDGSFEKGDYDVNPPFDTGFSCHVVVTSARVLHIEGTWNVLPVGTHIRFVLRDEDYPDAKIAELNWDNSTEVNVDPPKDRTFLQDDVFVRDRHFSKDVDMSKDPTMYPCTAKNYILEFYYSPRLAPAHIQDKFSWNGEGMLDSHYADTTSRPAMTFTYQPFPMSSDEGKTLEPVTIKSPGQRIVYAKLSLTRDQLLKLKEWTSTSPTVQTPNYKATGTGDESGIISIPTLRGK